jgi:Fe-S-cluster-containing hydrogenase component 2
MTQVERREREPEPSEETKEKSVKISRREFLIGTGTGVAGLIIGGAVGRVTAPTEEVPPPDEVVVPPDDEPVEVTYKANHMLDFDPTQCTGCMMCAVACAEKWAEELYPEQTNDVVNLEFARIRPMRFQLLEVVSVCSDCKLMPWAEGSDKAPCEEVCPEDAIVVVPEGEGKEGYYGMGYKWIDPDKCLGMDRCWRCAEICQDQFGNGIFFDPIEKNAHLCTRCGGDPECVKACPEPLALRFLPAMRNGRFHAFQPSMHAELLYRKIFNVRRTL